MTYENLILEATDAILDNFVGTSFVPSVVSEDVINACNNEIIMENTKAFNKRVTSNMIGVLTRNTDMLNRKYQVKINETRVKREQIQQGTYFDMSDEQDEREDRSL